jgi:hypothetical protein
MLALATNDHIYITSFKQIGKYILLTSINKKSFQNIEKIMLKLMSIFLMLDINEFHLTVSVYFAKIGHIIEFIASLS